MSLSQNFLSGVRNRILGGLFAVSAGVVVVNEGTSYDAYRDSAGIWTICHGETQGVKPGQHATPAQCDAQLKKSLYRHSEALVGLPEGVEDVALVGALDMAYNIGVAGFKGSEVKRQLMLLNYSAASEAVLKWKYIHKNAVTRPSTGWVKVGKNRWQYDCSRTVAGKPNKVCWGLWTRRQWQAAAIGLQFKTPESALEALEATKR